MSRAALWRQEGNAKEREIRAEEIFRHACETGRRKASALPLWGDDTSFHFNPLLLQNCIQSPYFQKCCENLNDWKAVVDEIYYEVKSLPVFQVGKQPSTAFCLLLRLLTLRMTSQQMDNTLSHPDSPYIRAIGFLYLRFSCPPDQMFGWIEPYLQDEEEFTVERAEQRDAKVITIGSFVRMLFQSRDYYGQTTLPRLPIAVERDIHVKLLAAEKISERAAQHYKNSERMKQFQTIGTKVMALYGDEENPVTWYEAEIDRVITQDDRGLLKYPKFVVTFTEYGNTETVTLGELDTIGGSASSNRRDFGREDHRSGRDNRRVDLYDEVRRRERNEVAAASRGAWGKRPPTTKESLSANASHHRDEKINRHGEGQRSYPPERQTKAHEPRTDFSGRKMDSSSIMADPDRKRNADDMAAIAEKKRRLMAKYG
jgi:pre-mRNA-splicing factor 38B